MPNKIHFNVIHVSGQEETHQAAELNTHTPTTKGWQSARFCLYPQDVVIQLDRRSRLRKIQILSHQFLIATKIEIYIGDVPEGTAPSLHYARYTRLGYVALSSNEKTGFKARELKSVHVDAVGVFLKFVIHKNYVNPHNLYNQVGLIAVNVIGDKVERSSAATSDQRVKSDYISPLDDLSFDMYQDPEIAQIIRQLEKKKQDAILQERYDYAKRLKSATQELQKVGEKLGKYEVEKRQAVENEDFDKAQMKKLQMDEYRLQVYRELQLQELLGNNKSNHLSQPVDTYGGGQITPPRLAELPDPPLLPSTDYSTTPRGNRAIYEERPLPAITHRSPEPPLSLPLLHHAGEEGGDMEREDEEEEEDVVAPFRDVAERSGGEPMMTSRMSRDYDQRPAVAGYRKAQLPSEEDVQGRALEEGGTFSGEAEPMSEKDQRQAAILVDEFGLPLASRAYSKMWAVREDAIMEVFRHLKGLDSTTPRDDSRTKMKAAFFLINKELKDQVLAVFTSALQLLKMILTEFIVHHRIPKQEVTSALERTLPILLQRTGDTAARIRDSAKAFSLEMASFPEIKPLLVVPQECVKPFKVSTAPRLALSRTEIVEELYKKLGLQSSGLDLNNMMGFCAQALQHNAGDVRDRAEKIIITLYHEIGPPVRDYLPPDDDKTRRNVLYKQLFEAFDKIDLANPREYHKRDHLPSDSSIPPEGEGLQYDLNSLHSRTANRNKKERDENKKKKGRVESDDISALAHIEHICIFCGERNDSFDEQGLDLHYWKSCPMLKRCSYCKQVVEISSLTNHLLSECDAKDQFQQCPRCTEAVLSTEFDAHVANRSESHIAAEKGRSHCPLCHLNIRSSEEDWKRHLMGRDKDGCKQNPRRLQQHNKGYDQQGGKASHRPSVVAPPGKGAARKVGGVGGHAKPARRQ